MAAEEALILVGGVDMLHRIVEDEGALLALVEVVDVAVAQLVVVGG